MSEPARSVGPRSPREAVEVLRARMKEVGTETVPIAAAAGRVLAEAVKADRPSPPIDVSAMDGYALRMADVREGEIRVGGDCRIGKAPTVLDPGTARWIVTGAPLPRGAEAVIKREDVVEREGAIVISAATVAATTPGLSFRRRGENLGAGEEVVGAGVVVTAAVAGALATFGCAKVNVRRRVRVAVLVTGDELAGVDERPEDWRIRDSNGEALGAMVSRLGWAELVLRRRVPDDVDVMHAAVEEALAQSDALVMTGGVSMGDRDHVPGVLRSCGVQALFHKLPQRPGRPVLAAIGPQDQLVLGLPGNPVSVLVTARRLLIPALARMAGLIGDGEFAERVELDHDESRTLNMWWHRLAVKTGPGRARLVDVKGSGDLVAAARSDGVVEIPPGHTGRGPWSFYGWSI